MRIEEFQDLLNKDLAWRKMEISHLFMVMNTVESKNVVYKSMILLLYAHWEGFIKKSSKLYLKYVSDKNINVRELTGNFEAIMLKKFARECIDNDSKNLSKEFALIDKQRKIANRPFNIPLDINNEFDTNVIDTQHNLSSKVLENIIQIIGIEYNDAIKTRTQYVDINLVNNRNTIGHGSQLRVNEAENESSLMFSQIVDLKDFVIHMLDYFTEVLIKYVEEEFYLCKKSAEREEYERAQQNTLSNKLSRINNL